MNTYLAKLIRQGEHQEQDFKYCVNDSKKIAKSLVAFANTNGGRLLIGIKDNGNIAGVRSEEEYYMVEAAAKLYSKPEIEFKTKQHHIDGKTVLEITIDPSIEKPHFAKGPDGKWLVYFRKDDENKLANKVMLEVWKKQKSKKGVLITYSDNEKVLLDFLDKNETVTLNRFARIAHISYRKAEKIIIDLIVIGLIKYDVSNDQINYRINEKFDRKRWEENSLIDNQ